MATEQVVEQVAEHLEEAAVATRQIDTRALSFLGGGIGVGFVVGFYFGYRFNKERLRAEAYADSEKEVALIREAYRGAYEARNKPPLEKMVDDRGYNVEEIDVVQERPTRPPVPVQHPRRRQDRNWDYEVELPSRNKHHPYVIHQDEFKSEEPNYTQVTWTYYVTGDVLLDEHDEPVMRPELTVGEENLKRFGHGSDDENVVFVRNDRIEMEFEICRTMKDYETEVLGMDGTEPGSDDADLS